MIFSKLFKIDTRLYIDNYAESTMFIEEEKHILKSFLLRYSLEYSLYVSALEFIRHYENVWEI